MGRKATTIHGSKCICANVPSLSEHARILTPAVIAQSNPSAVVASGLDCESWLVARCDDSRNCRIGCFVCESLLPASERDIFGKFQIERVSQAKKYRLKMHSETAGHINACCRLIDPTTPDTDATAPPSEDVMMTVLNWVRQGGPIREGIPGVCAFKKCRRIVWGLSEGTKRISRKHLKKSSTVNLLRDERHARLLIRFRCASKTQCDPLFHLLLLAMGAGGAPRGMNPFKNR